MKWMVLYYSLVVMILFSAALGSAQTISADVIHARIHTYGARRVAAEFAREPAKWEQVLNHVQSGDPSWLQLAVELKPVADAGLTGSLDQAVSLAIQNNASGVLELTSKGFPLGTVCQDRQIEPSPAQHTAFLLHTRAALEKVSHKDLLAARNACLNELQP